MMLNQVGSIVGPLPTDYKLRFDISYQDLAQLSSIYWDISNRNEADIIIFLRATQQSVMKRVISNSTVKLILPLAGLTGADQSCKIREISAPVTGEKLLTGIYNFYSENKINATFFRGLIPIVNVGYYVSLDSSAPTAAKDVKQIVEDIKNEKAPTCTIQQPLVRDIRHNDSKASYLKPFYSD